MWIFVAANPDRRVVEESGEADVIGYELLYARCLWVRIGIRVAVGEFRQRDALLSA